MINLEKPISKYNQVEAYCIMTYQCENQACGKEERIWNSRDGVTPFTIGCRYCGGMASHVRWNEDRRVVNYKPKPGERIFINMTEEMARVLAEKRVDQFKGTPYERTGQERDETIEQLTMNFTGGPTLVEVKASTDDMADELIKLASRMEMTGMCKKKTRLAAAKVREAAERIMDLKALADELHRLQKQFTDLPPGRRDWCSNCSLPSKVAIFELKA